MEALNSRIESAAEISCRTPDEITLIAVTKSFPPSSWDLAYKHLLTTIAESRIQETKEKLSLFKNRDQIDLHLFLHQQIYHQIYHPFYILLNVLNVYLLNVLIVVC